MLAGIDPDYIFPALVACFYLYWIGRLTIHWRTFCGWESWPEVSAVIESAAVVEKRTRGSRYSAWTLSIHTGLANKDIQGDSIASLIAKRMLAVSPDE